MLAVVATEPISASTDDFWTAKAPMPQTNGHSGAAVVNEKIYVIADNITCEYTPATDTWVTKTPMPTPRGAFGIAAVDGKIYVIGGYIGEDYAGSVVNEAYDPATDTWETRTSMPRARWGLEANVVNGKIYLIGGYSGNGAVEAYDPAVDSWSTKTPCPVSVDEYASAVLDGKIYVIGGHEGGGVYTNNVRIYDPENDAWSDGQPAPQKVVSGAAGVTSGGLAPKRIYVLGTTMYMGLGTEYVSDLPPIINQVFNPENNSWSVGASLSFNRLGMSIAMVDDKLYAIGGYPYETSGIRMDSHESSVIEEYTPIGYQTQQTSEQPPSTEQFAIAPAAAGAIAAIAAIGLGVYFKKHRH